MWHIEMVVVFRAISFHTDTAISWPTTAHSSTGTAAPQSEVTNFAHLTLKKMDLSLKQGKTYK